jgi:hypothetical protein
MSDETLNSHEIDIAVNATLGVPQQKPSSFVPAPGCAVLVDEVITLLTDVAQLLDGWHNDGTAWSEWDEHVRQQVTITQQKLYALKQHNDQGER